MKTKLFNELLNSLKYTDIVSGELENIEIQSGNFLVIFNSDCDIKVTYFRSATHFDPEEFEIEQTKNVSNIKVLSENYEVEYNLNNQQQDRLKKEIEYVLNVVY